MFSFRTSIMVIVSLVCVLPLGLLRNVDSLSNVSAATIAFYFCLVMKVGFILYAMFYNQLFSSIQIHYNGNVEKKITHIQACFIVLRPIQGAKEKKHSFFFNIRSSYFRIVLLSSICFEFCLFNKSINLPIGVSRLQ